MRKLIADFCTVILLLNLTACNDAENIKLPITDTSSSQSVIISVPTQNISSQPQNKIPEPEYTHAVYEISIYETLLYNNSVGNEWFNVYYCGEEYISSGKQWTVLRDTHEKIDIEVCITEDDKQPDTASHITTISLCDGFQATETITVTESNGRYKGNTAAWKISYKIKLVDKLIL